MSAIVIAAIPDAVLGKPPGPALPPFDPAALEPGRLGRLAARIGDFFLAHPRRLRFLAWLTRPLFRWFFGIHTVTGYDDVREVLEHHAEFPVPWEAKMLAHTNQVNFVLGMKYDAAYKAQYQAIATAFPLADLAEHVTRRCAEDAEGIVAAAALPGTTGSPASPPFDVVEKLILTVSADLCESYLGVRLPRENGKAQPVVFCRWTLAVSAYMFSGGAPDPEGDKLGIAAAAHLSDAIRSSITEAREHGTPAPVMAALVKAIPNRPVPMGDRTVEGDDLVHSILFGMVLGFIPTDVLAGGNILETLLRHETFRKHARQAVADDDDELLWKCLRETLRFRHINPGILRACSRDYTIGAGGPSEHRVPAKDHAWALTAVAMFDERRIARAHVFDPMRPDDHYLVFGVGQHWCVGAFIAQAHLTQCFKALLRREFHFKGGDRNAHAVRYGIFYPLHLEVELEP